VLDAICDAVLMSMPGPMPLSQKLEHANLIRRDAARRIAELRKPEAA
jgi:hypothetical protein